MSTLASEKLAIEGGKPLRVNWPARHLFGEEEKQAAIALFDQAIATGEPFGYNGAEEEAYCQEFAQSLGGGYADGVNSGSSAVYVALRALNLEPFTEVIVPPVSDPGGYMPVPLMNCIPIPADSAVDSYNAGPRQIADCMTDRTSAIVVAHIAGQPVDMDPVMELARRHNIPVVEDCAQAHGAAYKGRPVGTIGTVGAFSTMSGKHHATGAQGGVVFTKDESIYWNIRRASDRGKPFGLPGIDTNVFASLNFNSNDLSAAVGRVQLRKLPGIVAARQRAARAIAEEMRDLKSLTPDLGLPGTQGSFWFIVMKFNADAVTVDKQQFFAALEAEGLPIRDSYLNTMISADWYRNRTVFGTSGYPWASPLYKGDIHRRYTLPNVHATDAAHLNLPIHERFGQKEAIDIAAIIRKVESAYAR